MIEIKEGALFVADAHYPHHGDEFMQLLREIGSGERVVSQLFLMGDIFDLLFGYNDYIITFSAQAVSLLQKLSQTIEIYYFEGNHDFCLKNIFPNMVVYSRDEQPIMMKLGSKRVALSHGDKYETGFGYGAYCKLLRNKITLNMLKPFEKKIINYQMDKLPGKIICRKMPDFKKKVKAIISHYRDADLVIEGHFHQAVNIGKYISLPSLACQKKIAIVQGGNIIFSNIH
ncbi:MAG: UDP-2,3-diacylglucosamine diphosphatase [Campylobacterales bacterium]|nr:UDP-2,3-diacylglucosamine diphosphatase [Campylobacterales bacterium]